MTSQHSTTLAFIDHTPPKYINTIDMICLNMYFFPVLYLQNILLSQSHYPHFNTCRNNTRQHLSIRATGCDSLQQHTLILTFKYQYGPTAESCQSIDGRVTAEVDISKQSCTHTQTERERERLTLTIITTCLTLNQVFTLIINDFHYAGFAFCPHKGGKSPQSDM